MEKAADNLRQPGLEIEGEYCNLRIVNMFFVTFMSLNNLQGPTEKHLGDVGTLDYYLLLLLSSLLLLIKSPAQPSCLN